MKLNTTTASTPAACADGIKHQGSAAMIDAMRAAILCIDEGNPSRAAVILSAALDRVEPVR